MLTLYLYAPLWAEELLRISIGSMEHTGSVSRIAETGTLHTCHKLVPPSQVMLSVYICAVSRPLPLFIYIFYYVGFGFFIDFLM